MKALHARWNVRTDAWFFWFAQQHLPPSWHDPASFSVFRWNTLPARQPPIRPNAPSGEFNSRFLDKSLLIAPNNFH